MHTDEYGSTLATLRRSVADAQFAHSLTRSLPHSPALRLGFRLVKGFSEAHAAAIARARGDGPFASIEDFTQRTGLSRAVVVRLAKADAFGSLHLDRRNALWQALEVDEEPPLFRGQGSGVRGQESGQWSVASGQRSSPPSEGEVGGGEPLATDPWPLATGPLAAMPPEAEVFADYQTTGLSLKAHPVSFVRSHLDDLRAIPAARLATLPTGRFVRVAGLVLLRQQPSTAKGIRFVTLEDETGTANLVVRPDVWDHFQHVARTAQALLVHGRLERQEDIIHVVASKLEDLSRLLKGARTRSRDFR